MNNSTISHHPHHAARPGRRAVTGALYASALAASMLCVGAASGQGATTSVSLSGGEMRVLSSGRADNAISIAMAKGPSGEDLVAVRDTNKGHLTAGRGCTLHTDPESQKQVWCPADDVESIQVKTGIGDDEVTVGLGISLPTTMRGGDGNDTLHGSNVNDALYGDDGNDTLTGYLGDDDLHGGRDNDTLISGPSPDGYDHFYGGPGNDQITSKDDTEAYPEPVNGGNGTDTCVADPWDILKSC